MNKDYYQILQVHISAEQEVIKAAYQRLMQKYHPDKNPTNQLEAKRRTQDINEAWSVLSDPNKRANYDRNHVNNVSNPTVQQEVNTEHVESEIPEQQASEFLQKISKTVSDAIIGSAIIGLIIGSVIIGGLIIFRYFFSATVWAIFGLIFKLIFGSSGELISDAIRGAIFGWISWLIFGIISAMIFNSIILTIIGVTVGAVVGAIRGAKDAEAANAEEIIAAISESREVDIKKISEATIGTATAGATIGTIIGLVMGMIVGAII